MFRNLNEREQTKEMASFADGLSRVSFSLSLYTLTHSHTHTLTHSHTHRRTKTHTVTQGEWLYRTNQHPFLMRCNRSTWPTTKT